MSVGATVRDYSISLSMGFYLLLLCKIRQLYLLPEKNEMTPLYSEKGTIFAISVRRCLPGVSLS